MATYEVEFVVIGNAVVTVTAETEQDAIDQVRSDPGKYVTEVDFDRVHPDTDFFVDEVTDAQG